MTATSAPPKSILLTSKGSSLRKRHASFASASCSGISTVPKTTLSVGKLRSLRNYYARRRPSMQPPNRSIVMSPMQQLEQERHTRVRFRQDNDRVHLIPNRRDYSKQDKQEIWMPRGELKKLILKNYGEFAYEGRDWRKAPEEHEFVTMEGHKEPQHPVYARQQRERKVVTPPPASDAPASRTLPVKKRRMNRLSLRKLPLQTPVGAVGEVKQEPCDNKEDQVERENKRPRTGEC